MLSTRYSHRLKALARELAGYDHFTVIESAFKSLQYKKTGDVKQLMRLPWVQFFLLKLALLAPAGGKKMNAIQFNKFANRLYAMQLHASGIDAGDAVLKLRPMLLQQLWYQRRQELTYLDFARQEVLFSVGNSWYRKEFKRATGIELSVFYKISMYCITLARKHTHTAVNLNLFSLIYHLCPKVAFEDLIKFLRVVGVRSVDLPSYFESHKLTDNYQSEFFQDTPLKEKPILINGGDLLVFDVDMLFSSMSQFVPEVLKKIPGYKERFGSDFESYVGELLAHSRIPYWSERQQIASYYREHSIKGRVVDFLIERDGDVILIESKAIEPSPIVKTATDEELLKKLLADSFIKAIKQGAHSAFELGRTGRFAGKRFFLLVVTHVDFGIYGGRWVAEYVDKELESWIGVNYPGVQFSLDDVVYCTISDLEELARGHLVDAFDLFDVVKNAGAKDSASKRMVFSQVFNELPKGRAPYPEFLTSHMDKSLEDMDGLFKDNREAWAGRYGGLVWYRNEILKWINLGPVNRSA